VVRIAALLAITVGVLVAVVAYAAALFAVIYVLT
jgi:hypothetical protein